MSLLNNFIIRRPGWDYKVFPIPPPEPRRKGYSRDHFHFNDQTLGMTYCDAISKLEIARYH